MKSSLFQRKSDKRWVLTVSLGDTWEGAKQITAPTEIKAKRVPKYTPVSRRQDRPNAILWLLRHHGELKDTQIMRLVGTTKSMIVWWSG